jgi:hypothetical protein
MKKHEEVNDIGRLIIYLPFLQEGLEYAKENKFKEILINSQPNIIMAPLYKKIVLDVNMISNYNFIESIILNDSCNVLEKNINLNKLSVLNNLNKIEIWIDDVFSIDFSLFKKLSKVSYYDSTLISGFCKLDELETIAIYNLKSECLDEFSNKEKLKNLILWDCNNQSIDGLLKLKNLRTIEIIRSKKIKNLNGLKESKFLKDLKIYNCNQLEDITVIKDLIKLEKLSFNKNKLITNLEQITPNNIEFLDIDTIDNLYFIKDMCNLKFLIFKSVKNNDLTPLLDSLSLKNVCFVNKKSYTYTEKEINSIINNSES